MKFHTDKTAAWAAFTAFASLAALIIPAPGTSAQAGFPDRLRQYSDSHTVPFRIGTAVTLQGGPSLYPPNGYQPGLLTNDPRDKAYQALVRGQFNQIEAGNETKMMSLWTGGAARVNGHYAARTNLFDASGPLSQLCTWAGAQKPRLTVRGHCIVYYRDYTLPTFPAGQPPLFVAGAGGKQVLNTAYTPEDLRDMLRSYVEQVVDATMAQNAAARAQHGQPVVTAWDVTNEVVSEDAATISPQLGFAYRDDDPWYSNGPSSTKGTPGYDYIQDIYRWTAQEMAANAGKTLAGHKITPADGFALYYNDYDLEWKASKLPAVLALIAHIRAGGGRVDGLGIQGHVIADGLNKKQFEASISAAIAAKLRFSLTEVDCAIKQGTGPGQPTAAEQQTNQGREYGEMAALCVRYRQFCDSFQIWGATDDGSWLQNAQATPITRWVEDTRPGATHGQMGYWPKQGQFAPETLFDPKTKALNPQSGQTVSTAYDQMAAAFAARSQSPASTKPPQKSLPKKVSQN